MIPVQEVDFESAPAEAAYANALAAAEALRPLVESLAYREPALCGQLRRACADLVMAVATAHIERDPVDRGCAWAAALGDTAEVQALLELIRLRDLADGDDPDQVRAHELLWRLSAALPRLLAAAV